jgi:hypothetical protein
MGVHFGYSGGDRMILYLTSRKNNDLLDFLDEKGILIKKLEGDINFKNFVVNDVKNIDHYSYVIVDLEALQDSENDLIDSLIAFKKMYMPKLVLIAHSATKLLKNRIVKEADEYNLILSSQYPNMKEEIEMCLFDEDNFKEKTYKYIKQLNLRYSFTQNSIKIFLIGLKSKFSVTKNAINLATYLAEDIGASVSLTGNSSYLNKVAAYYNFNEKYKDVEYFYNGSIPLEYDFNIVDLGILKKEQLDVIKEVADSIVICGSCNQSEHSELINLINHFDGEKDILLSYSSDKEKNAIKKLLKGQRDRLFFIDDKTGLFDTKDAYIFRQMVDKYLVESRY